MKKKYALIVIIAVLILTGCSEMDTGTSRGLNIESSFFALNIGDGNLATIDYNRFRPGTSFSIVLMNVSGFKKGADGFNRFDIDLEVSDANGTKLFEDKGLLGVGGKVVLENNIAKTPCATFTIAPNYPAGKYKITVTVRDVIGGGKASVSKWFEVIVG